MKHLFAAALAAMALISTLASPAFAQSTDSEILSWPPPNFAPSSTGPGKASSYYVNPLNFDLVRVVRSVPDDRDGGLRLLPDGDAGPYDFVVCNVGASSGRYRLPSTGSSPGPWVAIDNQTCVALAGVHQVYVASSSSAEHWEAWAYMRAAGG